MRRDTKEPEFAPYCEQVEVQSYYNPMTDAVTDCLTDSAGPVRTTLCKGHLP